jgi:signal transduction histidine kinase
MRVPETASAGVPIRHDGDMTDAPGVSVDASALLDAVAAMNSDLELGSVLQHIVQAACRLTGAQYGALGVIGADDDLGEFVTHGLTDETRAAIGDLPHGRGILGLLIRDPRAIRLRRLQDHPASFGFPPNHPPMASFLGVPLRVRGTVFGNLYLTEKAGKATFTETDEHLVEALAGAAAVSIETARAFALSDLLRSWLEATTRLNDSLRPGTSRADALGMLATAVRSVTSAPTVGVVQHADGAVGIVAREGREAAALEEVLTHLTPEISATLEGRVPPLPVRLATSRIAVIAPIRAHLFGTTALIVVLDRSHLDAATGPAEIELLTAFASQAGLALDRLQALADREKLAVVTDRDRIARDLHDLVIQRLFAAGLQLQGLRAQSGPEAAARIDQVVSDLDTTIHQIRSTIFALRQPASGSPRAQLIVLAAEYTAVLGFPPSLRITGPIDTLLTDAVADQLLAVLREALSNVARHARASRVDVDLTATPDGITVSVSDDGVGLAAKRHESGLANLRARAESFGGRLSVSAADPQGTVLTWHAPFA